jgi:hypothetical protein
MMPRGITKVTLEQPEHRTSAFIPPETYVFMALLIIRNIRTPLLLLTKLLSSMDVPTISDYLTGSKPCSFIAFDAESTVEVRPLLLDRCPAWSCRPKIRTCSAARLPETPRRLPAPRTRAICSLMPFAWMRVSPPVHRLGARASWLYGCSCLFCLSIVQPDPDAMVRPACPSKRDSRRN